MKTKTELVVDAIFLIALAVCAVIVLWCAPALVKDRTEASTEPVTQAVTTEITEYITEPTQEETAVTEPSATLYDVPLDYELQLHIISEATEHNIDPAIIFAMAFYESTYRTDVVNKYGCYGLLQIKKSCHRDRMKRLGVTDLLDPYQNVTVAVDYLAEQINRYDGNVAKGISAYNKGHYPGYVTQYAKTVLAKAERLAVM